MYSENDPPQIRGLKKLYFKLALKMVIKLIGWFFVLIRTIKGVGILSL